MSTLCLSITQGGVSVQGRQGKGSEYRTRIGSFRISSILNKKPIFTLTHPIVLLALSLKKKKNQKWGLIISFWIPLVFWAVFEQWNSPRRQSRNTSFCTCFSPFTSLLLYQPIHSLQKLGPVFRHGFQGSPHIFEQTNEWYWTKQEWTNFNILRKQVKKRKSGGQNSSVGRALDWRSKGPWFNPGFWQLCFYLGVNVIQPCSPIHKVCI